MKSEPVPVIALVIPVFNEEEGIRQHLCEIHHQAASEEGAYQLKLVVVDDGSTDGTARELQRLATEMHALQVIHFTRNFGKEAAITAGFSAVAESADAVVLLDSDLQHPPALIPRMVQLWQAGALVVEAYKASRGDESAATKFFARFFYGLFRRLAGLQLEGQSDYKLLDKQVVSTYLACPERHKFFRGLIQWMAYPTARLPFDVLPRQAGQSQWTRLKLLRYALHNITAFSSLPLAFIFWLGLFSLLIGCLFAAIALYQKIQGISLNGFTTVILLVIFFGGLIMLSLGIVGHYLARIYDEIKGRPGYIIRAPGKKLLTQKDTELP